MRHTLDDLLRVAVCLPLNFCEMLVEFVPEVLTIDKREYLLENHHEGHASAESDVHHALGPLDDGLHESKCFGGSIGSMVLVVLVSLDTCVELETSH
jgi:hypothetical protein